MKPVCRKCKKPFGPGEQLRLWDGRDYCCKCVETAHKGLVHFVRKHETLIIVDEAKIPWKHVLLSKLVLTLQFANILWVLALLGALPGVFYGNYSFLEAIIYSFAGSYGFMFAFSLAGVVLAGLLVLTELLASGRGFRLRANNEDESSRREVRVCNGRVDIQLPDEEIKIQNWKYCRMSLHAWNGYLAGRWSRPMLWLRHAHCAGIGLYLPHEAYPLLKAAFKLMR